MSIVAERAVIVTNSGGVDQVTVRAGGCIIRGIRLEHGTLAAGTDITITEQPSGDAILTLTNQAADGRWAPTAPGQDDAGADVAGSALPVAVFDRIQVAVAQGGDTKTGVVTLLLER